jgi:hypothetical protein
MSSGTATACKDLLLLGGSGLSFAAVFGAPAFLPTCCLGVFSARDEMRAANQKRQSASKPHLVPETGLKNPILRWKESPPPICQATPPQEHFSKANQQEEMAQTRFFGH